MPVFKQCWVWQELEQNPPPLMNVCLEEYEEDNGKKGRLVKHGKRIHKSPPSLYFTVRSQASRGCYLRNEHMLLLKPYLVSTDPSNPRFLGDHACQHAKSSRAKGGSWTQPGDPSMSAHRRSEAGSILKHPYSPALSSLSETSLESGSARTGSSPSSLLRCEQ